MQQAAFVYCYTDDIKLSFEVIESTPNDYRKHDAVLVLHSECVNNGKLQMTTPYSIICYTHNDIQATMYSCLDNNIDNIIEDEINTASAFVLYNDSKVCVYAGGYKYTCLVKIHPKMRYTGFRYQSDIIKLMVWLASFRNDFKKEIAVKDAEMAPIVPKLANFTLNVSILRSKCIGAECWLIPARLNGSLVFKFDRNITKYRLVKQARIDGCITVEHVRCAHPNDTNTILISANETLRFWFVDNNENVVNAAIISVD
ncbi:hypothetical protein D5b_00363 [Faustovirus]|nr:hypothetical protein D5b_00363 [Faustovirus]AMN84550.1 hypothetical protein D6_00144 [Faustovirus]AMP44307.1 hypothetical protein PRJ_Dakar_00355 [Faustovirus]